MKRTQFPLMPCFGMTISKSQGQTLSDRVRVVLDEKQVWTHGQLYVALGRVTDPRNLRVLTLHHAGRVVNIV